MILSTAAGSFWDWRASTRKRWVKGPCGTRDVSFLDTVPHLKEVGQLVLHQASELSPVERGALAVVGGVTVEHLDE